MVVNGNEINLENECSLIAFLELEAYNVDRVAVERNGEIVPRSRYAHETLSNGDCLEVVTFIGGG